MLPAPRLSALTGAEVFVKYENLQVTNSFKERGARPSSPRSTSAERERGVIAMSAGNHAQAVAYHAALLGISATIVMPVTTPFVKVAATKAHGARVVLDGETISEAQARGRNRGAGAQADLGASLRRSPRHRGAGHDRARNAGRGARPRRAGDSHRRRRADRPASPTGRKAIKPAIEIVGVECGALSVDVERDQRRKPATRRRDARRGHCGARMSAN